MPRLTAGSHAPEVETVDHRGARFSLAALRGKRVVLGFDRFVGCPFCSLRLNQMIEWLGGARFDGFVYAAVLASSPERLRGATPGDVPFPVLSDAAGVLYERYGVERSVVGALIDPRNLPAFARALSSGIRPSGRVDGPITRMPAEFLIDEGGRIVEAFYASYQAEHLPIERIEAFARTGR
jgi:peroxiredoxin Q/BCP